MTTIEEAAQTYDQTRNVTFALLAAVALDQDGFTYEGILDGRFSCISFMAPDGGVSGALTGTYIDGWFTASDAEYLKNMIHADITPQRDGDLVRVKLSYGSVDARGRMIHDSRRDYVDFVHALELFITTLLEV